MEHVCVIGIDYSFERYWLRCRSGCYRIWACYAPSKQLPQWEAGFK